MSVYDKVINIKKIQDVRTAGIFNRTNQNHFPQWKEGNNIYYVLDSCSSLGLNLSRFVLINKCSLSQLFNYKSLFSDRKTYGRV